MSLQVWLPLTGDLHNQGLADIIATNNGATYSSTGGKFGGCYTFGGSSYIDTNYGNGLSVNNTTIACWFKPTADCSNDVVFGALNGSNQRCYVGVSNSTYNLAFGSTTYGRVTTASVVINEWAHIAMTVENNEAKLYVNGNFIESLNNSTSFNLASNIFIGGRSDGYKTNSLVNDVRIYNHALTEKEVREISRGLVLHYPLNDKMVESTTNLLPVSLQNFTVNGTNNPASYSYSTTEHGQYTLSCDIKRETTDEVWTYPRITLRAAYTSGTFTTVQDFNMPKDGQWHHYELTVTTDTSKTLSAIGGWILDHSSALSKYATVSNAQLEFKGYATPYTSSSRISSEQVVHDISGYQNNGTITGTLGTSTDTVRYKVATYFDGSSYIVSNYYSTLGTGDFTISAWIKLELNSSKTYQPIIMNKTTGAASVGCGIYFNHNQNKFLWSTADGSAATEVWTANTFADIYDKWTHVVMVRNSSDLKKGYFYIDGVRAELASVPVIRDVSNSTYPMVIGAIGPHNYSTYQWTGGISDVRLYTTALSADDIKELYEMGVSG